MDLENQAPSNRHKRGRDIVDACASQAAAAAAAELVEVLETLYATLQPHGGDCALSHMAHRLATIIDGQIDRQYAVDDLWVRTRASLLQPEPHLRLARPRLLSGRCASPQDHSEALWSMWEKVKTLCALAGRDATLAALPPALRVSVVPRLYGRGLVDREYMQRERKHSRG